MNSIWVDKINEGLKLKSKSVWYNEIYSSSLQKSKDDGFSDEDDFIDQLIVSYFQTELIRFEEENIVEFFEYLNLSIISGECFLNDFSEKLELAITICGNFIQHIDFDNSIKEEIRLGLENAIIEIDYMSILKKCLIEYESTSNYLLRLITNPSLNTLFDLSDQTQDILDELKIKGEGLKNQLVSVVGNNLILLRKDFNLKYELDELKCLLISKNELIKANKLFLSMPNNLLNEIVELLIEKTIFLIRKFIIRKYKEEDVHNENYVFLGKESNFDFISHKLEFKVFKEWDRYSKNHFLSEDNYEKAITLNRNSQKILKIGKISALDFHALTKCYKDLNTDLEKLNELLLESHTIPIENISFDNFSLNKIKNYISNNIFSETIRNISLDSNINIVENIIERDIKIIQKIQNESFLNNFFPYYKICDFLNKYIDSKIIKISLNNSNSEDAIKEIDNGLIILKKYFDIYKRYLKWSKVHLNYSYQLPFKECLKRHDFKSMHINVFSASTFSLPIEFEKYDEFEKFTEASILRVENEIKSLSNLTSIMKSFEKDRDELQDDIKSNSQKNIELLGIFSAIIALLFQGVYTVNSNVKYEDKLFTLVTMFLVLISFLLMLRSFYSKRFEREELITIKIVSFLIIPLLLIATIILFKIF